MKKWLPLVVLAAFTAVSAFVLKELTQEDKEREAQVGHIVDFYMESFSITVMDENGQPSRKMMADYMAHFADNETKELEHPHMVMYQTDRPPWHITSERGWVSANDDVMLLLGEVHIWRDNEAGVRELEIETQDLRVLPQTQYGETDKPVVIRTPSSETTSTGMRAYLEQRRIELLSGVKTVYENNEN